MKRTAQLFLMLTFVRLKDVVPPQVSEHCKMAVRESMIAVVHWRGVRKARKYHDQKHLRLNVGSGTQLKQGFINIDFCEQADIRIDLRRGIPFSDQSCEIIFTEHFLEHLSYPEGIERFLRDAFRVLEPSGELSISVPDTHWPLEQFLANNNQWIESLQPGWHPSECTTYIEHLNFHFRQRRRDQFESDFDCHRFAYDFETLEKKLSQTGFVEVETRQFDPSLDSEHRRTGSLLVQAKKL